MFDEKQLEEWLSAINNGRTAVECAGYRPDDPNLEAYLCQREDILTQLTALVQSGRYYREKLLLQMQ